MTWAYEQGNKWGLVYLGKAYFYGRGVQKDYMRARQLLGDVTWSNQDASYMLGVMYAQGLGVDQDIRKGIEHLQKAGDLKEARDELAKYKKNLFGKWIRRK